MFQQILQLPSSGYMYLGVVQSLIYRPGSKHQVEYEGSNLMNTGVAVESDNVLTKTSERQCLQEPHGKEKR